MVVVVVVVVVVAAVVVVVAGGGGCGHSCGCSLPFSVCLGDAAPAERRRYLFSDFECHISTNGLTVKRVL